jgi:hypothetical protein
MPAPGSNISSFRSVMISVVAYSVSFQSLTVRIFFHSSAKSFYQPLSPQSVAAFDGQRVWMCSRAALDLFSRGEVTEDIGTSLRNTSLDVPFGSISEQEGQQRTVRSFLLPLILCRTSKIRARPGPDYGAEKSS